MQHPAVYEKQDQDTMNETVPRNRLLQTVALVLVLGAGLLWRSHYLPLSPFVSKYGGDALWALAVFLGAGLCFRHASTLSIALAALGFAWGIEFSQLYHAPWIDQLRSSLPGRLVLGSTFNAPDLLAYLIGIVFGMAAEKMPDCCKRMGIKVTPRTTLATEETDERLI